MAKKNFKNKSDDKVKIKYPSRYGSHISMIDEEATKNIDQNIVEEYRSKLMSCYTNNKKRSKKKEIYVNKNFKDYLSSLKSDCLVAIKDDFGIYITERSFLDSAIADPNRYSGRKELIV